MREYTIGLKALKGFKLRIDITSCVQAIAASSVIERLANVGGYN